MGRKSRPIRLRTRYTWPSRSKKPTAVSSEAASSVTAGRSPRQRSRTCFSDEPELPLTTVMDISSGLSDRQTTAYRKRLSAWYRRLNRP